MTDDYKKNSSADSSSQSAYDELMGSYFGAPLGRAVSKTPASDKGRSEGFKLEIKDLDNEFNNPDAPKNNISSRAQTFTPSSDRTKTRPVRLYKKPVSGNSNKAADIEDDSGIKLMPAFENDKRYSDDSQDTRVVRPVYMQAENQNNGSRDMNSTNNRKRPSGTAGGARPQQRNGTANAPQRRTQSSAVISKANRSKPGRKKTLLTKGIHFLVTVAVCVALAALFSAYAISCVNDILAMKRDSDTVVTVNIPADTNTEGVINILKENKLIKHKYFCLMFTKLMHYRDDNYLTGIYYLTESMGLENMLSTFKKPTSSGEIVQLTFPEGYNVIQIAEKLEKYQVCTSNAFYTTLRDVDFSSEYSFIQKEDSKDRRFQVLEGYLYPDTYEFFVGENPASVVRKFLTNFSSKWTEEYQKKAEGLGMSMDDVITLASIIEKEAYGDEQLPLVSSVLHNRLKNKGIFPTLQCNATKDYIDNFVAKKVNDPAKLNRYMSDYNTYKCEGLPIGAICNPGDAAINAALNPADTKYYYFSHDKNKKIYLAATDAERVANDFERNKVDKAKGN